MIFHGAVRRAHGCLPAIQAAVSVGWWDGMFQQIRQPLLASGDFDLAWPSCHLGASSNREEIGAPVHNDRIVIRVVYVAAYLGSDVITSMFRKLARKTPPSRRPCEQGGCPCQRGL